MNLLFDTNIILHVVRAVDHRGIINFLNPTNSPIYVSVVSEGEIKSLALQNNWGRNRKNVLDHFLDQVNIVEINPLFINTYAEIDSYSQRSNPSFKTYPFETPRNMGKNDLWIASLAALLGLRLVTTDADFNHLNNLFFEVKQIELKEFIPYFKIEK